MSVRKRAWTSRAGKHEAWIVDYADQNGKRRHRTFRLKRDAEKFAATTHVQIGEGTHVADSASVTVKEAGELWLESSRRAHLETSTIEQYEQHLRLHIVPFIGREKLSKLSAPLVRAFQDRLHNEKRSTAMIRGVIGSLGAILADAQERGLVVRNAVRELRSRRRRSNSRQEQRNGKFKIGIDIPTPNEVRALLGAADGKWRVLLLTAVFSGLRASELRGLHWDDVDLKADALHVRQRADKHNVMGRPKSAAGERTVPLPPGVVDALRQWKLICPKKDGRLGIGIPKWRGQRREPRQHHEAGVDADHDCGRDREAGIGCAQQSETRS